MKKKLLKLIAEVKFKIKSNRKLFTSRQEYDRCSLLVPDLIWRVLFFIRDLLLFFYFCDYICIMGWFALYINSNNVKDNGEPRYFSKAECDNDKLIISLFSGNQSSRLRAVFEQFFFLNLEWYQFILTKECVR